MQRIYCLSILLMTLLSIKALAQADSYVSTGYCRFRQGAWEKDWVQNQDASFVINPTDGEIRFDHTTWASHLLKIESVENSQTEEGVPLIIYHCTEPANGTQWELKFNEWTVFDEATFYHYFLIELKNSSTLMRFMTRKAD